MANITGTSSGDILVGTPDDDIIDGLEGNDLLRGNEGNDELYGGDGHDFLAGGDGNDYLDGGAGFDRVSYFTGAVAGVTVDLRIQGIAQDTGQGMDTLVNVEAASGTQFGDTLTGDDNDNWIWGSASTLPDGTIAATNNDTLAGQGGNDLIGAGIGNHVIDGGSGIDTLYFTENLGNDPAIAISLALQAAAQDTGQGLWTISNVENLSGGTGDDQLTGDGNANILAGYTGNDTLLGGAGNDQLYGDGLISADTRPTGGSGPITLFTTATEWNPALVEGNDLLEGGLGDDLIDGGGGSDTATYANASGGVTVNLGFGFASGADGNDTLINIENVTGSEFNDNLTGNGGVNVLDGRGGNDTISGGAGDDTIYGGDGDDFLLGDFGETNIAATGNDVLHGGNGNDSLRGGLGNDQLFGGANNDLLRGNGGVDYFDGGADDGEGLNGIGDRVSFFEQRATQGAFADLRTGIISNDGYGNVETMVGIESLGAGTAFVDTFHGDDGRNFIGGDRGDYLYAYGGDDIFQLGSAPAVVDGGAGRDRMNLFASGNWLLPDTNGDGLAEFAAAATAGWTVNLAAGTIVDGYGNIGTVAGVEDVNGTHLGDTLIGDANDNVLNGLDGDDTLEGRQGNDTLDGGNGNDTASYANAAGAVFVNLTASGGSASGADGSDTLLSIENAIGSAYNDSLSGNSNANMLSGGAGHDRLIGNGGNDQLYGENGDDYITGGFGDDVIDGGAGFDRAGWYQVNPALGGVTVSLQLQGVAQNTGSQGWDTLTGIEYLSGTPFADTLTGDGNDNILWGSAATIAPGDVSTTNNDVLDGDGGNDLLVVGIGNHMVDGGSGIDTVSFSENLGNDPAIRISLALAGAAQATLQGNWTITNVENLSGGTGNDELTGDGNANLLAGYAGNDTLVGGAGDDTLLGDGVVRINTTASGGGSGSIETIDDAATLGLPSGDDLLEGGLGNDLINGGGGIDTASYANASGGVNVNLVTGLAFGADGNDTLISIENVTGSQFGDTLNGSGADNVIDGLGGNDFIFGRNGNDTIYGGDGDDTLRGDAVSELSLTESGNDIIYGGNGNDGLRGGLGDDQLYGGANNDLMRGNGGVDYFDGGSDDGEGFNGIGDRVSFFDARATQGAVADLRTGIISNDGFGNVEAMVGIESLGADTAYIDTFYGDDNRNFIGGSRGDFLYGFGGDDIFQTGAAANIDGGAGIDRLGLDSTGGWLTPDIDGDGLAESAAAMLAGWTVNLAAGMIVDGYGNIASVTGIENVNGSQLGDTLIGDANANVFNGFDGDDTLEGRGGNDTLDGGNGVDTASYANASGAVQVTLTATGGSSSGADGNDTLISIENVTGSAFNDILTGNDGANALAGGDGHDLLFGRLGNDTLLGGVGDDFLRGEDGDDILNGGAGKDRVSYAFLAAAAAGVTVNLNIQGVAQDTGHGMDTLIDIEHASGTIYNDVITGNGDDNWLWGGSNGTGVTGNDTISGGGGNDLIDVGTGTHTLDGGTGNDTLSLRGNSTDITAAGITFYLDRQGSAQNTEQGMMLATGFENVSGSIYDDFIYGDGGANVLLGDAGNDTLRGNDGDDTLYGDGRMAVDTHGTGGSGAIALIRDVAVSFGLTPGNDTMFGGKGNDTLYGGRGNDVMSGNQGIDRFVIETQSGNDRVTDFAVDVDKILFDALSGVDDFSDLTLTKVGSDTVISWGTSDSLRLEGIRPNQLDAGDFEFSGGAAAFSASTASIADSLSHGSTFGAKSDDALAQASIDAMVNSFVA